MKLRMPPYDAILVAIIEDYLDQNWQTQVVAVSTHGTDTDLQTVYHRGHTTKTYSRPIFELFTDGAGSTLPGPGTPCGCGDFSRSWACELHEELPWDPKLRRWTRPHHLGLPCDCEGCRLAEAERNGLREGLVLPSTTYRPTFAGERVVIRSSGARAPGFVSWEVEPHDPFGAR